MRIWVCVKQVPDEGDVDVDENGHLKRSGIETILNPYCGYALEAALGLRSEGDEVSVVSMGPTSAKDVLLRCLELGADKAVLLTDRDFAGSDTWATARTLHAFFSSLDEQPDIIICGKQAIDGDTAQVPAELAQMSELPSYYNCTHIWKGDDGVCLRQSLNDHSRVIHLKGPAVVAVSNGSNKNHFPSMADMLHARTKPMLTLGRDDLGLSKGECGIRGSLTKVRSMGPIDHGRDGEVIKGLPADEAAHLILSRGGWI